MEKEKPSRSKPRIRLFKYASFFFTTQRYSPTARGRPVISIVPRAARRKKNKDAFDTSEPTSPEVNCIGQVKHKKHCKGARKAAAPPSTAEPSVMAKFFQRKARPHHKSDAGEDGQTRVEDVAAPPIGQMRRFASGREGLAGFDWREKVYADDDGEEEEEVIVPHSAPIVMGGGAAVAPRKEVNLWKRRTTSPPVLLHLNS